MVADPDFFRRDTQRDNLSFHGFRYGYDKIRNIGAFALQGYQLWIGPLRTAQFQAMHMIDHWNAFAPGGHSPRQTEPVVGDDEMERSLPHEIGERELVVAEKIKQVFETLSPGQSLG